MKKTIALLLLLSTLSFTKETNTEPMGYDLHYVSNISKCGAWYPQDKDNTMEGDFRVIESTLNGQSYLYIDIRRLGTVIKVFSIDEIDCYNCEKSVEFLSCKNLGNNQLKLNFLTENAYEFDENITLLLDANKEKYTYTNNDLKYKIDLYSVENVDENDTLNLREKPNNKSKILAKLKPNTRGIKVFNFIEEEQSKWKKVNVDGKVGWVYAKYLGVE